MARLALMLIVGLASLAFAGCTTSGDGDSTGDVVLEQLSATFVDKPFKGGQDTPEHTWLQVTSDSILFNHWNHADPGQASGLMFVGDGFRAKGCIGSGGVSQEQVDDGFVHFHKETSDNWDRGHHTNPDNPNVMGYWLRHVGAIDSPGPMPGMPPIVRGAVYPLMPSHENAPACPLLA